MDESRSWIVILCGQLAPISSWVLYFSQIPTIVQIRKNKTIGVTPLLPYTSIIACNTIWLTYGILQNESRFLIANGTGFCLGCLYFTQYLQYAPEKSKIMPGSVIQHIQYLFIVMVIVLFIAMFLNEKAIEILGCMGVIFSISMSASPLIALKTVITTGSAKSISLPYAIAYTINTTLWGITGYLILHDIHVTLQSLFGFSFSITQLGIKIWFDTILRSSPTSSATNKRRRRRRRHKFEPELDQSERSV